MFLILTAAAALAALSIAFGAAALLIGYAAARLLRPILPRDPPRR